jgi:hypothetical protein
VRDAGISARYLRYLQRGIVNDHFMESSLDEATGDMFQLFSSLHQEIITDSGKFNGDAFPGVPRPDVKSRIPRPPMDC